MGLILLLFSIVGVIVFIPYAITLYTKSEEGDREFRELFYRECGWRGYRIVSAVGCFYPISLVSKLPESFESWMFILVVCGICYFVHLPLYKGVNIINLRRIGIFILVVIALVALQVLNRFGYISDYAVAFVSSILALFWGWYICLVRSRVIALKLNIKIGRFA